MWGVVRDYQRGLGFMFGGCVASLALMLGGIWGMTAGDRKPVPAAASYPALVSDNLMLRRRVAELERELSAFKIPVQQVPVTVVEVMP